MDEQLSILIELQEIDSALRLRRSERNRLPELLKALEQRRSANQEELGRVREALETAQKNKRDRDRDLEAAIQKVERMRTRTTEIKTNKEYQAMQKEVEAAEQESKAIEDDIITLMEKIDAASAQIKAAEQRTREEEAMLQAEQQRHEEAFAKLELELKVQEEKRQEHASRVNAIILDQYQKLLDSMAGKAVVEARGEACAGCYMSIPPQLFVNVKKNEKVHLCPHCHRILYFKAAIAPK